MVAFPLLFVCLRRKLALYLMQGICLCPLYHEAVGQSVVRFQVDLSAEAVKGTSLAAVGLRGSRAPLSWERTFPLRDEDGDGIYTGDVAFAGAVSREVVEYKFVYGEVVWELALSQNRILTLSGERQELSPAIWDKPAQIAPDQLRRRIPAAQLRQECAIVRQAFLSLHPGLYRYQDSLTMEGHFRELEKALRTDLTVGQAYLAYSRFLAAIRCGHTYGNFWNQPTSVKQLLFDQPDKISFYFRLIDRRMVLTKTGVEDERLRAGVEIKAINGVPVGAIVDTLMRYAKGDGANDAQRRYDMQLNGVDEFEAFDVFFPLLFPPVDGAYALEAVHPSTGAFSIRIAAVTREDRKRAMETRYGPGPATYDDTWAFRILDDRSAYLKLGTFVVWKMSMDWKAFLHDAFQQLTEKNIPNLIIDIRGNGGGADEAIAELGKYLVTRPLTVEDPYYTRIRYQRVPAALNPYLDTWDQSVRNLEGRVVPAGGGYYRRKGEKTESQTLRPAKQAYTGKVYLLIDASNSSATYILARIAKAYGLATLVGQETGGNLRGITGGMLFFLRLPHSEIEMDIPLYASFPITEQPDSGVRPDIYVAPGVEDVVNGVDAELEAVRRLIRE